VLLRSASSFLILVFHRAVLGIAILARICARQSKKSMVMVINYKTLYSDMILDRMTMATLSMMLRSGERAQELRLPVHGCTINRAHSYCYLATVNTFLFAFPCPTRVASSQSSFLKKYIYHHQSSHAQEVSPSSSSSCSSR
jgi:hypothetical protein